MPCSNSLRVECQRRPSASTAIRSSGQALSRRNRWPPATTISCWRTGRGIGQASMSRCKASSSMLSMPLRGRLPRTTARRAAVPRRPRLPTRSRTQMRSTAATRPSIIASWAASSTTSRGNDRSEIQQRPGDGGDGDPIDRGDVGGGEEVAPVGGDPPEQWEPGPGHGHLGAPPGNLPQPVEQRSAAVRRHGARPAGQDRGKEPRGGRRVDRRMAVDPLMDGQQDTLLEPPGDLPVRQTESVDLVGGDDPVLAGRRTCQRCVMDAHGSHTTLDL